MMIGIKRLPVRHWIMPAIFAAWSTAGHAIGLGPLQLQSWLGQPLQAVVPLLGESPGTLAGLCVKAVLESPDGDFIAALQSALIHEPQAASLRLSSPQMVGEPAIAVSVRIGCGMSVKRTYQVLLDPPAPAAAAPEPAPSAALPAAAAQAQPAAAGVRHMPARPKRAVLQLSSPDHEPSFDLKLATSLADSPLVSDPQKAAAIRVAHARFAALLRNEDPLHDAELQARSARERLQIQQAEIDLLKERRRIDQARLDQLEKKPDLAPWVAALTLLLLASAAALIWLALRPKAAPGNSRGKWWETVFPNEQDDPGTADPETPKPADAMRTPAGAAQPRPNIDFVERRFEPRPTEGDSAPFAPRAAAREGSYPFHALASGTAARAPAAAPDHIEIVKAEEISDVLQEVEFWSLLNDRARVLEILEPLARADRPDSPAPWLYLLDIYRDMRDQARYEALRERLVRLFNVNISRWDDLDNEPKTHGLEDFPHVLQQICESWQRPDIVSILESLLLDNRDGTREGFDLPVYRELMMLIGLAKDMREIALPL